MAIMNAKSTELKEQLKQDYMNRTLLELPTPAAVLDLAKVKNNCTRMLEVADTLDLTWRAHIKTHKTEELTRLQLGDKPRPANVIVSTIKEAENITPLLLELKTAKRSVNVLYGFPIPLSGIARLATVSKQLGPEGLSLLVDHPDQLPAVYQIKELSGNLPQIYIKIDMGYGRAGVAPQSQVASQLISDVLQAEEIGAATFYGLYTHAGQSYYGHDIASAIDLLRQELGALLVAAESVKPATQREKLVLSVGATPTTTSIRNLLVQDSALTAGEQTAIAALKGTIQEIKGKSCEIELHAGVYSILDVQQLATHALSAGLARLSTYDHG